MAKLRWERLVGSGIAYTGACNLLRIIFLPSADAAYVDICDGQDATAGKKFARLKRASQNTEVVSLPFGVHFDVGIYLATSTTTSETTVVFEAK